MLMFLFCCYMSTADLMRLINNHGLRIENQKPLFLYPREHPCIVYIGVIQTAGLVNLCRITTTDYMTQSIYIGYTE